MTALAISGIGVCAPGLPDWQSAQAVFCGTRAYEPAPIGSVAAASLPPIERRRANKLSHLALHVAAQAVRGLPADVLRHLPAVFCSPDGDGQVLAQMLAALAQESVALSPTLFHNSVYNAAAGYWGIASHCDAGATTVCAGEASFAAGLMETYAQVCAADGPVLYVAFNAEFPDSLDAFGLHRPPFACALLMGPAGSTTSASSGSLDGLSISTESDGVVAPVSLRGFFAGNAAASALPLLVAIATHTAGRVSLPYLDDTCLHVTYTP